MKLKEGIWQSQDHKDTVFCGGNINDYIYFPMKSFYSTDKQRYSKLNVPRISHLCYTTKTTERKM